MGERRERGERREKGGEKGEGGEGGIVLVFVSKIKTIIEKKLKFLTKSTLLSLKNKKGFFFLFKDDCPLSISQKKNK